MITATFILFDVSMIANAVVFPALGQGGGGLYTPIQLFFGTPFHTAAAATLFLVMVTSLSSTLAFHQTGTIDWPVALALVPGIFIASQIGARKAEKMKVYSGCFLFGLAVFLALRATFGGA